MKFWKKLLYDHKKNGGSGLTIPFIIGSQNYMESDFEKLTIRELINDLAFDDERILFRYCPDVSAYVIDINYNLNNVVEQIKHEGKDTNIALSFRFKENLPNNLIDFAEEIEELYKEIITKETYSAKENIDSRGIPEWQPFLEKDIKFIQDSFKLNK